MKLRSAQPDPDALPHGLKDVQVRATRWGIVAQGKPRSRKRQWSKLQWQYRQRFAWAARFASDPTSADLRIAIELAKGTQQVPRDILTMAALGQYYVLENPDGSLWGHVEGPVYRPDLVSPPDPDPEPAQEPWTAMQWTQWDDAWLASFSSSFFAFKGGFFTPQITATLRGAAAIINATASHAYAAAIGTADASNTITSVTVSAETIPTTSGHQMLTFPLAVTLEPDQLHFFLVGRTNGTATFQMPVAYSYPAKWLWPCKPGPAARLAQTMPATGQVLDAGGGNTAPPFGLDFSA